MGNEETPIHAALWRRGLARFIDYFAMLTWLFAMQIVGVTTSWVDSYTAALVAIAILYAMLEIVYVALRGQTPAKELLKIRVVHPDKTGPPGWRVAITRWVLPGLALVLPWSIILIVLAVLGAPALFDPQRRTLYDRLAAPSWCPMTRSWPRVRSSHVAGSCTTAWTAPLRRYPGGPSC